MGKLDQWGEYIIHTATGGEIGYDAHTHEGACEEYAEEYEPEDNSIVEVVSENGVKKKFRIQTCIRYLCSPVDETDL